VIEIVTKLYALISQQAYARVPKLRSVNARPCASPMTIFAALSLSASARKPRSATTPSKASTSIAAAFGSNSVISPQTGVSTATNPHGVAEIAADGIYTVFRIDIEEADTRGMPWYMDILALKPSQTSSGTIDSGPSGTSGGSLL
jgi:hypothetical protein